MNFLKNALTVLQLALGLVPNVIELVKVIEVPGNGPAKARAVTDFILAAFEILPDEVRNWIGADKIAHFARKVIETVVSYLNAVGIFKPSPVTRVEL